MDTTTPVPTQQQRRILEEVHQRCKYEYFLEQELPLTSDLQGLSSVPLYRLIHGLPGSGKSRVLLWIRNYFEDVWQWTHEDEFVFLAPQNGMADNIGGNTLHSHCAMSFKDRRGRTINSKDRDRNWSALLTKMSLLRFIFVDEVEATGADLLGRIEEECRRNSRRPDRFRFPDTGNKAVFPLPRAFGGVNVFLIGDWWQLNPTGGIALMSNPFAKTALECSVARSIMMSVWLQTLTSSTLELSLIHI